MPDTFPSAGPRLTVAMLAYPGMTLLDLVGPHATWAPHADIFLVWKTLEPLLTDTGVTVLPTHTFGSCPPQVDILFVPGGLGTWDVLGDAPALHFLRNRAEGASYVTSVCTGSIILAAAGLLEGRAAATHWTTYSLLEEFNVRGVHDRVVTDGNRITGGGVTAGIDFGLTVVAALLGEDAAKVTQLMLEYSPAPPFDAGSPARAGERIVAQVTATLGGDLAERALLSVRAAKGRAATLAA